MSWVRGDFKLNLKGRKEDGVVTPKQTIIWLKMQIDKQCAGAQLVLEYINIRLHHRVAQPSDSSSSEKSPSPLSEPEPIS